MTSGGDPGFPSHVPPDFFIDQECQPAGDLFRTKGIGDDHSAYPLSDQILCPNIPAEDNGQRGGHGLQDGNPEGVEFRKQGKGIGGQIKTGQLFLRHGVEEEDLFRNAQLPGKVQKFLGPPLADDQQPIIVFPTV